MPFLGRSFGEARKLVTEVIGKEATRESLKLEGQSAKNWIKRHPKSVAAVTSAGIVGALGVGKRSSGRSGVQGKSTGGYA